MFKFIDLYLRFSDLTVMAGLTLAFMFLLSGTCTLVKSECSNGETCKTTDYFELEVNIDGDDIELNWKFNNSKMVYGFQARVYKSDRTIVYKSPILHQTERSMTLQQELDGKGEVCVIAYENSTKILDEKCEKIEITDLKIVIGILAGVIFLIPCIIGISYVIYKDFKVQRLEYIEIDPKYGEKTNDEKKKVSKNGISKKKVSVADIEAPKCKHVGNTDNKAFVVDEDLKQTKDTQRITQEPIREPASDGVCNTVCDEDSEKQETDKEKFESDLKYESSNIKERNSSDVPDTDVTVTEEEVSGTSL